MIRATLAILVLTPSLLADSPYLPPDQQKAIKAVWPESVDEPAGLRFYNSTWYSQRLAVTNGVPTNQLYQLNRDDVWGNAPTSLNPNRQFPYRVPGGLHDLSGWQSFVAVAFPIGKHIEVWDEMVPVAQGVPQLKRRWGFPSGTVFVDVLTSQGKAFEIRQRKKKLGVWDSSVIYRDHVAAPRGYRGAGKACVDCHKSAGASEQYGITVRGDDQTFSFPVLREGTLEANREISSP